MNAVQAQKTLEDNAGEIDDKAMALFKNLVDQYIGEGYRYGRRSENQELTQENCPESFEELIEEYITPGGRRYCEELHDELWHLLWDYLGGYLEVETDDGTSEVVHSEIRSIFDATYTANEYLDEKRATLPSEEEADGAKSPTK